MRSIYLRPFLMGLAALAIAGCGGGGGGGSSAAAPDTADEVAISLTDAAADKVASFTVPITRVVLIRASGSSVSMLPPGGAVTVDVAQLVDVSDLIAMKRLPAGVYRQALLDIDYSQAQCVLSTGTAAPATLRDASGAVLNSTRTEAVIFTSPIVIPAPAAQHIELDFNLDAGLQVDEAANSVTVTPAISATPVSTGSKPFSVACFIQGVVTAPPQLVLDVRPRLNAALPSFGTVTAAVETGGDPTVFVLDNRVLLGAQGLAAVAQAITATASLRAVVVGDLSGSAFVASYVLAGSTLPLAGQDLLDGTVLARTATTATLGGVLISPATGNLSVTATATISFPAGVTVVTEVAFNRGRFTAATGTADDIDVGSHATAFGSYDANARTLSGVTVVRRRASSIVGSAIPGSSDALHTTVDLVRINRFPVRLFTPGGSWDPSAFRIDHNGIATGPFNATTTPVRAIGFFAGLAPSGTSSTDFKLAKALIDRSNAESAFGAYWERIVNAAPDPLNGGQTGPTQLSLDLRTAAGTRRAVYDQGLITTHDRLGTSAYTVTPRASGFGIFVIAENVTTSTKTQTTYTSFATFQTELSLLLSSQSNIRKVALVAAGRETSSTALTADVIFVGVAP